MQLPHCSDVEDFIDNVSEVSRLIESLKAGTISPEYVDKKIAARTAQQEQQKGSPAAPSTPQATSKQASSDSADEAAEKDDAERKGEAARQAELLRKVEELKTNRARKLRARQRFDEYSQQQNTQAYATDYAKWDLWCPSDEEDDMFNSIPPNNPAFRAMERDINDRHARMVEQRQIAERQRQAGNAAFKAQQYSEALRCYQAGLEVQRHSMALHANAAAAALKLQCYVQALEHCDKVLHLADVLHNMPQHPLCVKALQRRAAARQALGQHSKAVEDLTAAAAMLPGDKELTEQLARAQLLLQESRAAKRQASLVSEPAADIAAGGAVVAGAGAARVTQLQTLQQMERLVQALAQPGESCWHPQLRSADAVGVLVAVAYAHGRGSAVARNAAIGLARMAHDAEMMERLRELHGIEIIYQYVRP
ncbi:hypothetical protein OEZ86_007106 [Tetradesmus obliquus]|nr:hypothetical protein OEZ86_007106 [Tetradesmus obliquus]